MGNDLGQLKRELETGGNAFYPLSERGFLRVFIKDAVDLDAVEEGAVIFEAALAREVGRVLRPGDGHYQSAGAGVICRLVCYGQSRV